MGIRQSMRRGGRSSPASSSRPAEHGHAAPELQRSVAACPVTCMFPCLSAEPAMLGAAPRGNVYQRKWDHPSARRPMTDQTLVRCGKRGFAITGAESFYMRAQKGFWGVIVAVNAVFWPWRPGERRNVAAQENRTRTASMRPWHEANRRLRHDVTCLRSWK